MSSQPHALSWGQEVVSAGGTLGTCILELGGGHSGQREQWVLRARELGSLVKCRGLVWLVGADLEGGVRGREQEPGWDKQGSGCE